MNRTLRNGLAVAGMAGGMLFLGQAVASASDAGVEGSNNASAASDTSNSADTSNDLSSVATGGDGGDGGEGRNGGDGGDGGDADSRNDQDADARNNVDNNATTGDIDAKGGTSYVVVFAGNGNTVGASSDDEGDVDAAQNVRNEVNVASSGGDTYVAGSNNASAGNGASNQASASNGLDSGTTGGDGGDGGEGRKGGDAGDGGDADSRNDQDADARNNVDNDADTGDIDARGGNSGVFVVAGNGNTVGAGSDEEDCDSRNLSSSSSNGGNYECEGDEGDVDGSQDVRNEVNVASQGGDAYVWGSNNAAAGNGASNRADASNDLDSGTTGGDGGDGDEGRNGGDGGEGGDADSDNDQDADSRNNVDNDAETGDIDVEGGDSIIKVIVGNDNTLECYSEEGDVDCKQYITNIVNIISIAGGAGVTCSNNASAGGPAWVCHKTDAGKDDGNNKGGEKPAEQKPAEQKPAQVAPVKHYAAPVAPGAAMLTTAQPKGQLAYTGAETTAPLALGLIALGFGGALTFAGRRRSTTAAA